MLDLNHRSGGLLAAALALSIPSSAAAQAVPDGIVAWWRGDGDFEDFVGYEPGVDPASGQAWTLLRQCQ